MSPPEVWFKYIRETRKKIRELGRPRWWEFRKNKKLQELKYDLESYHRTVCYYPYDDERILRFYEELEKEDLAEGHTDVGAVKCRRKRLENST